MSCSGHSLPFILSNSMRVKTLLGTDRSVTPLQFLHILKSPFFGSFTKYPFFHSVPRSSGIDGATHLLLLSGLVSEPLVVCRLVRASFRHLTYSVLYLFQPLKVDLF